LIAGTAAVVGASAIAITPVMGAQLSLPSISTPTVAKVALAGLDSPISELLGSVILGGQLLLNANTSWGELPSVANPAGNPNPGVWGPSAFGTLDANGDFVAYPGADGLMYGLANQQSDLFPQGTGLYNGLGVGVLPQIIDDALPIIRQLGINGSDYLNVTVAALSAAGIALSEGVWNAAGALLTLDIQGAVADLVDGISAAGTLALGAGAYVLTNVLARAQAVFQVLSGSLSTLVQATVAQIGLVVARTVQVVTDTFAATSFEGGWNAAIDGIFGATGVPGTILNVTVGAGQFAYPNTAEQAFVPSVRTVVRGAVVEIADALLTTAPTTASVAAPAAAAKAARSAASVRADAVEAAPAAEAPAGDSNEAAPAGDSTEAASAAEAPAAEAPAAEAAAEKPARKAARAARGAAARG
jgi:hypothetical protein